LECPEDRPLLRQVQVPHQCGKGREGVSRHGLVRRGRLLSSGRVERPLECPDLG
jgi:hypothetical protein